MESYSKEFRREVLAACDAGEGRQAVALRFRVSMSWVRRIKQVRREHGRVAPLTRGKIWEPHAAWRKKEKEEKVSEEEKVSGTVY